MATHKIKVRKGELPEEWMGRDWWGEKEWAEHNQYVEELKAKGEYLQEVEYEITTPDEDELKLQEILKLEPKEEDNAPFWKNTASNFAIMIPKDDPNDAGIPPIEFYNYKP